MVKRVDWSSFSLDLNDSEIDEVVVAVGTAIIAFSTLEIQVGRALSAAFRTHDLPHGDALVAAVDAVSKQKLLDGIASVFTSDVHGVVPDYVPQPQLAERHKSLARLFQSLLPQRNTIAHGTPARVDGRLMIGAVPLWARLRSDGGSGNWVYLDELGDYHARCNEALQKAAALRTDYENAWLRIAADEADTKA